MNKRKTRAQLITQRESTSSPEPLSPTAILTTAHRERWKENDVYFVAVNPDGSEVELFPEMGWSGPSLRIELVEVGPDYVVERTTLNKVLEEHGATYRYRVAFPHGDGWEEDRTVDRDEYTVWYRCRLLLEHR